uniref:Ell-associated factor Eaf n=1 Tax=Panagrellus redivivus TaxID=6233 RepID=A0A7E4ZSR7_PANRE
MISSSGSPATEASIDSAEAGDIPCGTYHLEFGSNFLSNKLDSEYHTLKFDIKPPAFAGSALFTLDSNSLKLTIPTEDADGSTVYRGPVTGAKNGRECLLLFDGENMRLEKVSTTMSAKHVRKVNGDVDDIDFKNLPLPAPAQGYSGPSTIASSVGSMKEPRFKQNALNGFANRQRLNPFASTKPPPPMAPPTRAGPSPRFSVPSPASSSSSHRIISPPSVVSTLPSMAPTPTLTPIAESDPQPEAVHDTSADTDDDDDSSSSSSSSSSGSEDEDEKLLLEQISETMPSTISAHVTPPPPSQPTSYPTPPGNSLLDDLKMSDDSEDEPMDYIMDRPREPPTTTWASKLPSNTGTPEVGSGGISSSSYNLLHSDLQLSESSSEDED